MRATGAAVAVIAIGVLAPGVGAQGPTMPSTLRYGSGLLDVPVSSVLPHLRVTGTFSGFRSSLGQRVQVDESGEISGYGEGRSEWYTDAAFAVGLWDRIETGLSLQAFGDDENGGDLWGLFGRVRLWQPVDQGLGLAVGARWLSSPSFADGAGYAPGRLGFPDERLRDRYTGTARGVGSELSAYVVGTAFLRGFDGGPLPENDVTLTLGYGGGLFRGGGDLAFYAPGHANGWFFGGALHVQTGSGSLLTAMVEHNGFDVNVGAQLDWDGVRVGAHYLATNHAWPASGHVSEYQKPKFGFVVSLALCPTGPRLRCRPRAMERIEPDTIYIPPPPPDTVMVGGAPTRPVASGEPISLCLSTGRNVPATVTAAGDTVLTESGISLGDAGPDLVLAGSYAGSAFWYLDGRTVFFENAEYGPIEEVFPVDCTQILRVGVYEGVPVFSTVSARRPLDILFIPVSPGAWQRYERGIGRGRPIP